jgi:heme-degrading monooxygenase HmoA
MRFAQVFRYTLDLDQEEYAERWASYAHDVSEVPGLLSKTWMADFETKTFASFYVWRSKEDADRFMASDLIARVAREPFLKDLSITTLPIMENPSRITRGLSA